jgi:hypothetical protein
MTKDQDESGNTSIVIAEIYGLFRDRGDWPTFAVLDRRLDHQRGLDAEAAVKALPRRVYRASRFNDPFRPDQPIKLTLAGVAQAPGSQTDIALLVRFLRWVAEREQEHDPEETGAPLVITGADAVEAFPDARESEGSLRRLSNLIELVPPFWTVRSGSPDDGSWQLTVGRAVRTYRNLRDIDDLLERAEADDARSDAWLSPPPGQAGPSAVASSFSKTFRAAGDAHGAGERQPGMVRPEAIDEFGELVNVAPPTGPIVEGLRTADERSQLEPALMRIIGEVDETPHGPTEIADLTTVRLRVLGRPTFAGVVIKGRARKTVRAADTAHQLQRAAALPGVGLIVLAGVGDIQDDAKQTIGWLADKAAIDWLILDRADLAHLFIAYGELCPNDGSWLNGAPCPKCGWSRESNLRTRPREPTILSLEDSSHAAARRYGVHLLVPASLSRAEIASMIRGLVPDLRAEDYSRNEQAEAAFGGRLADVLFIFVYEDVMDRAAANWICRAQWISPTLPEHARPMLWGEADSTDPALTIDWNTAHGAISAVLSDRLQKGPYLRKVDSYVTGAIRLADWAGTILEETAVDETDLASLSERVERLDGPDRSRSAPFECADLDNAFEALAGDLMNLALPFTERGQATWLERATRLRLARDALRRFRTDLEALQFEREKVR